MNGLILTVDGNKFVPVDMGVAKSRGTPKSSILIGFSIINHPFWDTPLFGNPRMVNIPLFTGFYGFIHPKGGELAGFLNHQWCVGLLFLEPWKGITDSFNRWFSSSKNVSQSARYLRSIGFLLMDRLGLWRVSFFLRQSQQSFVYHSKGSGGILLCHGKRFANELGRPLDNCLKKRYAWNLPPTQDASHHQDYYIFNRGYQAKPSLSTVFGWWVEPRYAFWRIRAQLFSVLWNGHIEVLQVIIGFVFVGSYIKSTMNYCHRNLANTLYFHNIQPVKSPQRRNSAHPRNLA